MEGWEVKDREGNERKCAAPWCKNEEFRIDGYCSIYCRDMHDERKLTEAAEKKLAEARAESEELRKLPTRRILASAGREESEMHSTVIYDCEIEKAIAKNGEERFPDILYCDGWRDFEGMGISLIGAFDYVEDRYRVFCKDNFAVFRELVNNRRCIVGFNSLGFDNPLCRANGLEVSDERSYDLLSQVWQGAGLGPKWGGPAYMGFSLDACCEANFGTNKSGHGAMAPVDWQRGNIGAVADYCLNDVRLTKLLFDMACEHGGIRDPRDPSRWLPIAHPAKVVF